MRYAVSGALAALVLVFALAGCGSGEEGTDDVASLSGSAQSSGDGEGGGASTTADEVDREEALLEFARCMREHGIDVPDPEPGGGPIRIGPVGPGGERDLEKFQAAQEACGGLLANAGPGPGDLSEADRQALEDSFLAFAQCMREHGIDLPDPQFGGEGGGFTQELGAGVDPSDPDFQEAQKACEPILEETRRGFEEAQP